MRRTVRGRILLCADQVKLVAQEIRRVVQGSIESRRSSSLILRTVAISAISLQANSAGVSSAIDRNAMACCTGASHSGFGGSASLRMAKRLFARHAIDRKQSPPE
jgi:hypothetical protein